MRRFRHRQFVVVALVAATTWACSSSTTTSPSTATTSTVPPTTTEVFSGQLAPNGAVTFPFATAAAGSISAILTTISPDSTLVLGLALGTQTGTTCQLVLTNDAAVQGTIVSGNAGAASSFCARVYDPAGHVVVATAFSITVIHP
jgi:hypothetical protein